MCGMYISFGAFHNRSEDDGQTYLQKGGYSLLGYIVHVVAIQIFANLIFFIKDIRKDLREDNDLALKDAPTLQAYRQQLKEKGIDFEHATVIQKLTPHFRVHGISGAQAHPIQAATVQSPMSSPSEDGDSFSKKRNSL